MWERFVSFSQTPLSDIPLQTVYVHHIHVQSVRWIPGRGGQRAVTSPHYTFHDTWSAVYVCVLEPCSLPFAVESWTPAGRSRLVVWPHRSLGSCLFFFSPGKFAWTTKHRKCWAPSWEIWTLQWANGGLRLLILYAEPLMRLFAVLCRSNASVSRQQV